MPPSEAVEAAGWRAELRNDELADITFRGTPVLRAIRAVVRDHDWRTLVPSVRGVSRHESDGGTTIRLVHYRQQRPFPGRPPRLLRRRGGGLRGQGTGGPRRQDLPLRLRGRDERPNPVFYRQLEQRISQLEELGIEADPSGHLLSIHNCQDFYDYSRPWITHSSIQRQDVHKTAEFTGEWRDCWQKPVVIDECAYEGNIDQGWGNITGEEMTRRFWEGAFRGGYVGHGETYMHAGDILWWAKGGELHGTSPERISFLRRILEETPGGYLEPLPGAGTCPRPASGTNTRSATSASASPPIGAS